MELSIDERGGAPIDEHGYAVISCDIKGHSAASEHEQVERVTAINAIVADVIASCPPGDVVWSSGGDGGHVVFRQDEWHRPAIKLMLNLYRWSEAGDVPMRIIGHYGPLTYISGADGRVQPIGNGINFSGWTFKNRDTWKGILVSDTFRDKIAEVHADSDVEFHDRRFVPNTIFPPHLLYLMSAGDLRSSWDGVPGDRAALQAAVKQDGGWDIIYFAKRIWQVNSVDKEAVLALENVRSHRLRYRDARGSTEDVNPFFGHLRSDELKDVLQLGQLIERQRGDVICRYDETGDTMFVILRGEVGVYNSEGTGFDEPTPPKHILRRGEIVGELAYALSRNRTADLVALSDVALLSFNYEDIRSRLASTPIGRAVAGQVAAYINYRVLQHVSDNAPYLLGPERTGPLAERDGPKDGNPWDYALTILRRHSELIVVDRGLLDLTLDRLPAQFTERKGLYILAAGTVREQPAGTVRARTADEAVLHGANFPVLWVDLPNLLMSPSTQRAYNVLDEPVKILQIAAEGIAELEPRQREALRKALPRAMNRQGPDGYEFDVFLCHSKLDSAIVGEIRRRLDDAGIKCWIDEEQIDPGDEVSKAVEDGLRSSRFLLACASANFAESEWAQRELRAVLHLDIKRRSKKSVLVLMLNEDDNKDDVLPLLIRDARRISYAREREFESLIRYIISARAE